MNKKFLIIMAGLVVTCLGLMVSRAYSDEAVKKTWRSKCTVSEPTGTKCNQFTFDSTGSYDPNNKKISVAWDFGDGTTSDQPVVKHAYEKAGDYTVTLKVTNNTGVACDTSTTTQTVKVNVPPVCAFTAPEKVCVGGSVTFDASTTTISSPENATYSWNFGDGTKDEGKQVTKVYTKPGTYNVSLMANDNAHTACSTCGTSKTIMVGAPPKADAGSDRDMCLSPTQKMEVAFDGSRSSSSARNPLTYSWDFGDGTTETGEKVTHTYAQAGKYSVKLTVNDESGTSCGSDTASITVSLNKTPIANAGEDSSACTGEEVSFDGSGSQGESGKTLTYLWVFGDGEKGEGMQTKHVYTKGGVYRAVLTVNDGSGSKCAVSASGKNVTISAPPTATLAKVEPACAGQRVSFDASGSSSPGSSLKYSWDFGDGTTEEGGSRVSHVYEKGGRYTVKVTVEKVGGPHCAPATPMPCPRDTASTDVLVNTPPVANVGPNLVCCVGKENPFDGSLSTGNSLTYHWNFGDGTSADGVKVTHTYEKPGTYKVTLTVDDGSGSKCSRASDSFTATVYGQPVSVIKVR